ncbi:hypothetical protein JJ685_08575 [Ramlibacter monticola]|uniref:Pyocin activator protein PrtN n=1 Tax=Ramlibacter monticola TaxID=1926872 RepID=A0A936YXA5_9BURK|nr:hypothetical protein [Ramlibacter monticola]MBL0391190.1 hypothetical protein [Ramlibacter monticola]
MNGEALEAQLFAIHGPVMGGEALRKALAYPSQEAFRMAVARGKCPVAVFSIPYRRGRFALVEDVAAWLRSQVHGAQPSQQHSSSGGTQ